MAKKECKMLSAFGLPSEVSVTMTLLKLLTLPRPIPVSRKESSRNNGLPDNTIPKKPNAVALQSNKMERLRPKCAGNAPAMKPAARLPTEWAESNSPLT